MIDEYFRGCLFFSSLAFHRQISRLAEQAFSVSGLSPMDAFLLMVVAENPGISFGLQAVVMVREPTDDETSFIGGRTNVDAEFEGVNFGDGASGASSADALFD